jgi:hypothetical protein
MNFPTSSRIKRCTRSLTADIGKQCNLKKPVCEQKDYTIQDTQWEENSRNTVKKFFSLNDLINFKPKMTQKRLKEKAPWQ